MDNQVNSLVFHLEFTPHYPLQNRDKVVQHEVLHVTKNMGNIIVFFYNLSPKAKFNIGELFFIKNKLSQFLKQITDVKRNFK